MTNDMDIFSVLREEHKKIKGIFEKMLETTEKAEKTREELNTI